MISQFNKAFPSEDACLDKLFRLRYGHLKTCPECGCNKPYKKLKGRKCYYCPKCYNQIHPMAGTIFHKSSTSLLSWFFALYLFSKSKNGLSAAELERQLGCNYKTSFRMLHKIREMLANDVELIGGVIEVDESFVGGKNKNRHKDKKFERCQGRSFKDKVPVFGMYQRDGKVSAYAIKNTNKENIIPIIESRVRKGAIIMSDEWKAYNGLEKDYNHQFIDHSKGQYAIENITTNRIENFWSNLKRTLKGSYITVSEKYLQNYVNEATFKFNNRGNKAMFNTLLKIVATDPSILPNQPTEHLKGLSKPVTPVKKPEIFFMYRPEKDM